MKSLAHKRLIWTLFILLQLFCLYLLTHHAMWRDELQTWSMARESRTIGELLYNLRYDGTPPLWYICLWLLTLISTNPLLMQLFHFACASTAATVVMIKAPFPHWLRLLTVSGYYFAFEYMIISRGYVLALLTGVIYAAYRSREQCRGFITGTILGIMANSTTYGCILSISLLLREIYLSIMRVKSKGNAGIKELCGVSAVYFPFLFFAIYFMIPAGDGNFVEHWNFTPDMEQFLLIYNKIALCLAPIPVNSLHYWNSLLLGSINPKLLPTISTLLLMSGIIILQKKRSELLTYLFCLIGMLIFGNVVYLGFNRHAGTLYICLIVCYWLQTGYQARKSSGSILPLGTADYLMIFLLAMNTVSFSLAAKNHLRYPFSGSREMAEYIKAEKLVHRPIIADIDFEVSPVAGYLDTPFYYLSNLRKETYIRWSIARNGADPEAIKAYIKDVSERSAYKPLFLFSYPAKDPGLKLLKSTIPSTVMYERYYLYERF